VSKGGIAFDKNHLRERSLCREGQERRPRKLLAIVCYAQAWTAHQVDKSSRFPLILHARAEDIHVFLEILQLLHGPRAGDPCDAIVLSRDVARLRHEWPRPVVSRPTAPVMPRCASEFDQVSIGAE